MCFILTINQILHMWHQLTNLIQIKQIQSPIPCKCSIQHIHTNSRIFYHVQGIECRSYVVLIYDVILNNFDIGHSSLHYGVEGAVTLHAVVNDFEVKFGVFFLVGDWIGFFFSWCWTFKSIHIQINRFILRSFYICHSWLIYWGVIFVFFYRFLLRLVLTIEIQITVVDHYRTFKFFILFLLFTISRQNINTFIKIDIVQMAKIHRNSVWLDSCN